MRREFLKSLTVGEQELPKELIDAIMAENGKDIEAQKALTAAEAQKVTAANDTIKQLQDTVKKFDGVDVEKLKADLAALQQKYDDDTAKLRLDNALEVALLSSKARDAKVVRALLDIDKIKLDGDKLTGLEDQIEALKKSHDYMFGERDNNSPVSRVDGAKEHKDTPAAVPATLAGALREKYDLKG